MPATTIRTHRFCTPIVREVLPVPTPFAPTSAEEFAALGYERVRPPGLVRTAHEPGLGYPLPAV
jgi:hypothetical protein